MSISTYHSQITTLEKEIQRLDDKIYAEQKKFMDRDAKINSVLRMINKNTSASSIKSKNDQIMRYRKEMLGVNTTINNYEKQKRSKKESLIKKKEALRKAELTEQKKGQQAMNRIASSSIGRNSNSVMGLSTIEIEEEFMEEEDIISEADSAIKVFVSYSWDTKDHQDKVFDFVNHLRSEGGFNAQMDKGLSQKESAINFVKMMYKAMQNFPKIVVVLSEGYKTKADGFTGGVGTEYELMINDINDHPNKYVLASFGGRDNKIIPAGFKGRDIVDLSDPNEMTRLYEKLMDHQPFVFAEVSNKRPELPIVLARPFVAAAEEIVSDELISIAPVIKSTGDEGLSYRKYKYIHFNLKFDFVNITARTLDGFSYIIKLPRELDLDHYFEADPDGFVIYQQSYNGKMFRGQGVQSQGFLLRVEHQNVRKIMDIFVKVEVFTEHGPVKREFPAKELIKIKPGGESNVEAVPISPDLFTS